MAGMGVCRRLDFERIRQQAQRQLDMALHGNHFIGGKLSREGTDGFCARNPATGEKLEPLYSEATMAEIDAALTCAERASADYAGQPAERVAEFLERIGEEIVALGDELIRRANAET